MDRRLKERLTGASILVLIAVLLIPELLSGPAKRATAPAATSLDVPANSAAAVRTYTVDLNHPPSEASAVAASSGDAADAAAASAAHPADSVSTAAASAAAASPAALEKPPPRPQIQTLPAAPEKAAPAPEEDRASAAVAGAAHDHAPHDRVAHEGAPVKDTFAPIGAKGGWSIQLGSFGNRANADKLVRTMRTKGMRVYVSSQSGKHRVRAGPFPDRATAERMGARLKSQGQSFTIVAP